MTTGALASLGAIVGQDRVDDWLLLGLAVAAALTFAMLLIRSRTFGEVAWLVKMTRKPGPPGAIRVFIEVANAGSSPAKDVSVWTFPHPTGPRVEVALSTISAGQELAVELDVPAGDWDDMWLEIRWRSRRGRGWPMATSYRLVDRTPPCPGAAGSP